MKAQTRTTALAMAVTLWVGLLFGGVTQAGQNAQQATFEAPVLVVNTSFLNVRTGPGVAFAVLATVVGGTELPVLAAAGDDVWYQVATNAGPGWVNVEFTLPRGSFANVPLASATTDVAELGQGGGAAAPNAPATQVGPARQIGVRMLGGDLRTAPDSNSPLVQALVPEIDNAIFPLLNEARAEGRSWYLTTIPGIGTGWSDRLRPSPLECAPGEVVGTVTQTTQVSIRGVTDTQPLSGGTSGYIVGFQGPFTELELIGGDVASVPTELVRQRDDNVISYCGGVTTNVTHPAPSVPAQPVMARSANRVVVNVSNLNVRNGAGANFGVITTLPGGAELNVLGVVPDSEWFLVDGAFGRGWVDSEFVLFRGDFPSVPIIAYDNAVGQGISEQGGGAAPPSLTTGNHVVVNTGNLNVRSGAGAGFSIVTTVPGGAELAALGVTPDSEWFLVDTPVGRGWVDSEFVLFRGDAASLTVIGYDEAPVLALGQGGGAPMAQQPTAQPVPAGPARQIGVRMIGGDLRTAPDSNSPLVRALVPEITDAVFPLLGETTAEGRPWYLTTIPGIGTGWSDRLRPSPLECAPGEVVGTVTQSTQASIRGTSDTQPIPQGAQGYIVGSQNGLVELELIGGDVALVPLELVQQRPDNVVSYCGNVASAPTTTTTAPTTTTGEATVVQPPVVTATNRVVVNTGNLNVRSGPGAGFTPVATVPGGSVLAVLGVVPDSEWFLVDGVFGRGWVDSEFVLFRGDFASIPVIDY